MTWYEQFYLVCVAGRLTVKAAQAGYSMWNDKNAAHLHMAKDGARARQGLITQKG